LSALPPKAEIFSMSNSAEAMTAGSLVMQLAVVRHQHHLVAAPQVAGEELPDIAKHPVAVELTDVEVVDVEHQEELLLVRNLRLGGDRRRRRSGRRGGLRRRRRQFHRRLAGVDGVEVGDLDRLAVLVELEVVLGQAAHPVAGAVGHENVDVDHVDAHGLEIQTLIDLLRRWRRLGLLRRQGAGGGEQQEGG
jgi:hypothetical protein